MKVAVVVCRILLGLGFVIFGLNIIYPFMPMPPIPPESLPGKFMAVMWPTHWMLVIGLVQLLGGVLVLIGGTAPLGLALLAPVLFNILVYHICVMGGEGVGAGLVFTTLELFLIYAYRKYFLPLATARAKPSAN